MEQREEKQQHGGLGYGRGHADDTISFDWYNNNNNATASIPTVSYNSGSSNNGYIFLHPIVIERDQSIMDDNEEDDDIFDDEIMSDSDINVNGGDGDDDLTLHCAAIMFNLAIAHHGLAMQRCCCGVATWTASANNSTSTNTNLFQKASSLYEICHNVCIANVNQNKKKNKNEKTNNEINNNNSNYNDTSDRHNAKMIQMTVMALFNNMGQICWLLHRNDSNHHKQQQKNQQSQPNLRSNMQKAKLYFQQLLSIQMYVMQQQEKLEIVLPVVTNEDESSSSSSYDNDDDIPTMLPSTSSSTTSSTSLAADIVHPTNGFMYNITKVLYHDRVISSPAA